MILPSDSDLPPERNDGDDPAGASDPDSSWWADSDAANGDHEDENALPGDMDDDPSPPLQSIAGPGWRTDLYKDLLDSLRELEAIEDPDDEFAPPEPPDLYTFFGELAALRNEFRHQSQRAHDGLNQLGKTLAPLVRATPSAKAAKSGAESAASAGPPAGLWAIETCLALISAWDLLPQDTRASAFAATFQPLLHAAGLTLIPTTGRPFDHATMTLAGTEKSTRKAGGHVIREITAGFLRDGVLLRPAGVIVCS